MCSLAVAGCASNRRFADRVALPEWSDFNQKVKDYTTVVDQLDKKTSPLPDKASAEQIAAHKKALGDAIRETRKGAQPGNIFTAAIQERFIKIVRSEVKGPEGKAAKKTIVEENPANAGVPVPLVVNAVYPEAAPLSTVPPTLLLRLPAIPETLEYRFVGKALVLRDVRANIIVDYIPNALT